MQYEKNTEQGRPELSENEITFAKSLDDALDKALGTGENVTSIWSHLKDEQRARLAEDYLAALSSNSRESCKTGNVTEVNYAPREPQSKTGNPAVPRGYPANFNPLAGLPGLEPSSRGPSPTDIIAGSLGNLGGNPLSQMQRSMQDAMSLFGNPGFEQPAPCQPLGHPSGAPQSYRDDARSWQTGPLDDAASSSMEPAAPNFWPLWMDQQDSLLKQCLKLMSGNMDDAQDALSEAMLKASVKFEDSMDEIRNHRAWLSRIVHNACIDLHRQNRRKAEYKEENHGTADAALPPISGRNDPSPEESFLATEMFDHLERALRALPEKLRKPLLMRCVEDRSYDDIADSLGLSNCAVRKRVQLARDHLRGAGIQ
ncbi:RNA polymerase sigma factor [Thalassospira australica]|uniref:RNA polymerase sigma factor n=1 Tax=Thalassospira australica TaxID=1528106 RepID=UPI00384E4BCC